MRITTLLMFLCGAICCGPSPHPRGPDPSRIPAQAHPSAGTSNESLAEPRRFPTAIRREPPKSAEGNASARVIIRNSYLTTQYVFVDALSVAVVVPGAEKDFELPAGAQVIMVSDSANGRSNAQYFAEVFDAGYEYRYEVVAR
jgi:hypothetical protein